MLHAIRQRTEGGAVWCGPAAISMVTGCTYPEAVRALKWVTGRRVIKATHPVEMRRALEVLGWRMGSSLLPASAGHPAVGCGGDRI